MLNWLLLIAWAGLIFFLSSQPDLGPKLPGIWGQVFSYSFHFTEYAILAFFAIRAFGAFPFKSRKTLWISVLVFGILYAVSDEFHQSFVPGREASGGDILVDFLGITVITLWYGYRNIRTPK